MFHLFFGAIDLKLLKVIGVFVAVYYDVDNIKDPISIMMNMTDENLYRMWEIKVRICTTHPISLLGTGMKRSSGSNKNTLVQVESTLLLIKVTVLLSDQQDRIQSKGSRGV